MNKKHFGERFRSVCGRIDAKGKDLLLLILLALLLIFTAWQIFHAEENTSVNKLQPTETEMLVIRLLEEIDGVGEADVIVYETKEGIQSVAIVCDGAKNLRVVMDVKSAVSAALGTQEKVIKVYLKKE